MHLKHWIFLLALAAFVTRGALALQGGQFYFGDEQRFQRGPRLYAALLADRPDEARWLLGQPDHQAFTWVSTLIAPAQHLAAKMTGHGDWQESANLVSSAPWGAVWLSLLAAGLVPATFRLAQAAGASPAAAGWAALLVAGSNTLFYTARHLLPYDVALLAWLLALWASCGGGRARWIGAGVAAALSFYLYNGYWFLVPIAALWHLHRHRAAAPAAWWSAGAIGVVLACSAIGSLTVGAQYYWQYLWLFSHTVKQGLFAEGWSLPWAYLWHSEGVGGAALFVLSAATLIIRRKEVPGHVRAALAGLGLVYGCLVLCSVGLEKFVVYGRSTRPLVPLAALAGGWVLACLLADRPPRVQRSAVLLTCCLFLLMQVAHFGRVFPRETEKAVIAGFGVTKQALTVTGVLFEKHLPPVTQPGLLLVNAVNLYPVGKVVSLPPGRELQRWPHPLAYLPYQYEGHTPRERAVLRSHDFSMRLIALANPAGTPDVPPPEMLFGPEGPADGRDHGRH